MKKQYHLEKNIKTEPIFGVDGNMAKRLTNLLGVQVYKAPCDGRYKTKSKKWCKLSFTEAYKEILQGNKDQFGE